MAPLIVTAALVPLIVLEVPPAGLAVTVNALLAGAESVSRVSSNVTDSTLRSTAALLNFGPVLSPTTSSLSDLGPAPL